jgi:hypothetical protein
LDLNRLGRGTHNNLGFGVSVKQQRMWDHGWMTVSHCVVKCYPHMLTCVSVERVHWLRAKAQFERWLEEQASIHNEAQWIPAYFHAKAEMWRKLMIISAQGSLKGHKAYASYQMHAWEELSQSSANTLSLITKSPLKHYKVESILLS